jgi:hypothetical protein
MLLSIPLITSAADLSQNLDALFHTDDIARQEELIAEISDHDVPINTLITLLKNTKFKKGTARGIRTAKNRCIDGIERPYYLYIPENYDHNKKTPLLVYLHGGVSRKDVSEDDVKYFKDSPFVKMAEEQSYILLFPVGQYGATWWDSVGIANILRQIRVTKREYNIDDNRVFMTGFSDGGSGSFLFAMSYPSYFAGFMSLNGHPGVGSEAGKIQTYFVNLFNRPMYVINTDEDGLYPADEIHDMIELAHEADADIFYRIYTGIGHEFNYAEEELPRMVSFMENNPRHLKPLIKWESAYPNQGCMWLRIDSIFGQGHADWYKDHNMEIVDDRVMFGFYPDDDFAGIDLDAIDKQVLSQFFPDYDFKGPAVKISKVIGDSTLCAVVGMKDGDVIIKLGDMPVNTIEDVYAYKENKKCGDLAEIVILRDDEVLTFENQFPGPTISDLFTRGKPSGRIEGYFSGNIFSLKTSQIAVFTIKIHPDMVQIDQNIVIIVNDEVVFDKKIGANPEYLLKNYLKNGDRERLYVNEITIALEE